MPLLLCSNSNSARRVSIRRRRSCCAAAITCSAIASTTLPENSEDADVDRELKSSFVILTGVHASSHLPAVTH